MVLSICKSALLHNQGKDAQHFYCQPKCIEEAGDVIDQ